MAALGRQSFSCWNTPAFSSILKPTFSKHTSKFLKNSPRICCTYLRDAHWDVRTPAGAKDFVYSLNPAEREQIMEQLKSFQEQKHQQDWTKGTKRAKKPPKELITDAKLKEVKSTSNPEEAGEALKPITYYDIKQVIIFNGIPFIGFGILDNVIMITAGEYIDTKFGTVLGISTMAAAALGNMVSDVAGVGTAGIVENTVSKLGIKPPQISPAQADSKRCRFAAAAGRGMGVMLGCFIGMFPLLFYDEEEIHIAKHHTDDDHLCVKDDKQDQKPKDKHDHSHDHSKHDHSHDHDK